MSKASGSRYSYWCCLMLFTLMMLPLKVARQTKLIYFKYLLLSIIYLVYLAISNYSMFDIDFFSVSLNNNFSIYFLYFSDCYWTTCKVFWRCGLLYLNNCVCEASRLSSHRSLCLKTHFTHIPQYVQAEQGKVGSWLGSRSLLEWSASSSEPISK